MNYLLDTNAISDLMRADPHVEHWMAGLNVRDRIVTFTIVRGEILFGISRLPAGRRQRELEQSGHKFLDAFPCESVPERAGEFYAFIKLACQNRGLALDENDLWIAATALAVNATLVSRDRGFARVAGLGVIVPA